MIEEERREMMRSNYADQMEMLGYDASGNPLDIVNVVRCKDCVFYNTAGCADGTGWCEIAETGVNDKFFCAAGERRDDNG